MKNDKRLCAILGGGGHARVVIDSLQAENIALPYAVLDENRDLWGKEIMGVPVRGGDDALAELIRQGVTVFAVGVGSVGQIQVRERLFEFGCSLGLKPHSVRHPSAIISAWAQLGEGSQVFPGSVINAGARLGKNTIVNTGAVVEHDCLVEDHVHIATGAKLCGGVCVGRGAHIGAGATVKEGLTVGSHAIIGAGAVVIRDVPAQTIVTGVPAIPLKK